MTSIKICLSYALRKARKQLLKLMFPFIVTSSLFMSHDRLRWILSIKHKPRWITKEVEIEIRENQALYMIFKNQRMDEAWSHYKIQPNKVKSLVRCAHASFRNQLEPKMKKRTTLKSGISPITLKGKSWQCLPHL